MFSVTTVNMNLWIEKYSNCIVVTVILLFSASVLLRTAVQFHLPLNVFKSPQSLWFVSESYTPNSNASHSAVQWSRPASKGIRSELE